MKNVQMAMKLKPNHKPVALSLDFSTLNKQSTKMFNHDIQEQEKKKQGSEGDLENDDHLLDLKEIEQQFNEARERIESKVEQGVKLRQKRKSKDAEKIVAEVFNLANETPLRSQKT
mmetsp:Transcript_41925/g.64173  ORF Transcript_41925/g.64173 Transcript_41925/m.64173 type:complete len:116 (+) Transcript_41925:1355-1702(+)